MTDDLTFITFPRAAIIAEPKFTLPDWLPVNFLGEASDGELLAEFAGRNCYQSWDNKKSSTNAQYIEHIEEVRHGSVIEHDNISVYIVGISRNLTHEQVRHRAGWAYSQLSQRYVDESDTSFVIPPLYLLDGYPTHLLDSWQHRQLKAREAYRNEVEAIMKFLAWKFPELSEDKTLLRKTAREAARSELPGACETRIVMTGNMRAWRHAIEMRASEGADREICRLYAEVLFPLLKERRCNTLADMEQYVAKDGRIAVRGQYLKV